MSFGHKAAIFLTAILLTAWLATASDNDKDIDSSGTQTAEQVYKNIQVLKGIPADQFLPAMQFIGASLGVHCEHCHVEGAFDKDDKKPKQQARQMMRMMMAINQNNFSGHREVTCYSCHGGRLHPLATPLVEGETVSMAPHEGETPPSGSPDEILNRYLQAIGGAGALQSIHSQIEKGTLDAGVGTQLPVEVMLKSPDKRSMVVHFSGGDNLEILNGSVGWSQVPGRQLHEMSPAEVRAAGMQADPAFLDRVRHSYSEFKIESEIQVEDHIATVVRASAPNLPPLQLCFDNTTGLLVRLVRFIDSPLGRNPTQIDYSDYRSVAGTLQPFRWTVSQPQSRYTVQLTNIDINQPLEDARFAQPEPRQKGH